jgi:hypothetical protein
MDRDQRCASRSRERQVEPGADADLKHLTCGLRHDVPAIGSQVVAAHCEVNQARNDSFL